MSLEHSHLAQSAVNLLSRSDSERITAIREERWITYPRARDSLELLARPPMSKQEFSRLAWRDLHGADVGARALRWFWIDIGSGEARRTARPACGR